MAVDLRLRERAQRNDRNALASCVLDRLAHQLLSHLSATQRRRDVRVVDDVYLCIVLDLFDQRVVGWSMHHRQDRQMVIRAVQMAVWQRQGSHPLILHSDRGSQFRSGDYQRYLAANGLVCSMSAMGHCGDNAACEGFFGLLKRERVYRMTYPTLDAARADVFEYIERIHNPRMRRRVARLDQKFSALLQPSVISG